MRMKWLALVVLCVAVLFVGVGCLGVDPALKEELATLRDQLVSLKAEAATWVALKTETEGKLGDGSVTTDQYLELIRKIEERANQTGAEISKVVEAIATANEKMKEQGASGGARVWELIKLLATAALSPETAIGAAAGAAIARAMRGPSSKKYKTKDGKLTDDGRERPPSE